MGLPGHIYALWCLKVAPYSFSLGVKNHLSQLPTCNLCFPKHSYDTQTPFRGCPGAGVPGCEWQPPAVNRFVHTHVMCSRAYLSGLLTPTPHTMPVCSQSDRLCLGTLTKLVLDLARVARRKFERMAASEPFTLSFTAREKRALLRGDFTDPHFLTQTFGENT